MLFLAAGQLQVAHQSTAISDVRGVLARSPLLATSLAVGFVALLGLPPFAMFASELAIARGSAQADIAWALAVALLLIVVAFGALARNAGAMLLGRAPAGAPASRVAARSRRHCCAAVAASVLWGVTAGPLTTCSTAPLRRLGAVR